MAKPLVLKEIIESRRSSFPKMYTGNPVEDHVVKEILRSADFAPQHKKTQPWRLRVFLDDKKEVLAQTLADIYQEITPPDLFLEKKHASILEKISKAHAIITITVNFSGRVPEWEEIAATAMAVQNMYLTANAHGVGCYWSTPAQIAHLDGFLDLSDNQKCYGLFYIGSLA